MSEVEFNISGITCMGCVSSIEKALYSNSNIEQVSIDKDSGNALLKGEHLPSLEQIGELVSSAGNYAIDATSQGAQVSNKWSRLKPLFLIFAFLLGVTLLVEFSSGMFLWETWMPNFMAGFFVVFSFFKFLDLKGFANAFRTYDIIAKKVPFYGYVFPFIELGLGIAYLLFSDTLVTHGITAAVTFVSIIGVTQAVLKKSEIQCACLGTVFNLPMSSVTIIENAIMFIMALSMILMS